MALRRAIRSGNWSSPSTWEGGNVPTTGDSITITRGVIVTFDVTSFSGDSMTVEDFAFLLFPLSGQRSLQLNNLSVASTGGLDLADTPTESDTGFITLRVSNSLTWSEQPTWFGLASLSPRVKNLDEGMWGWVFASDASAGNTTVYLKPLPHFLVFPNLVSLLGGKNILIPTASQLLTIGVSSAVWNETTGILTVTLSSSLPEAIPAGRRCHFYPDPLSSYVGVELNQLNLTSLSLDGVCWKFQVGGSSVFMFGRGFVNIVSGLLSGIVGLNICIATAGDFSFSAYGDKISIEHIGGSVVNTSLNSSVLSLFSLRPLSGSNFSIRTDKLEGNFSLGEVRGKIEAKELQLKTFTWDVTKDPSHAILRLGSDNISSSVESDVDWEDFLSYLASSSWTGKDGLVEIRNVGSLSLLLADFGTKDFAIYTQEFKPCKLDIQWSLRHDDIVWGKPLGNVIVKRAMEPPVAFGLVWEKGEDVAQSLETPSVQSTITGRTVELVAGTPDFEVLPTATHYVGVNLPTAGRVWLLPQRRLDDMLSAPWLRPNAAEDEVGFHSPATSATLTGLLLPLRKASPQRQAVGWRWKSLYTDIVRFDYYISRQEGQDYAAVVLRRSAKGWQCKGIVWRFAQINNENYPCRRLLSRPSLTVLDPENYAFGLAYYTYVVENGQPKRLSFQDNVYSDWKDDPTPSEIPVEIAVTNISTIQSAYLILSGQFPVFQFYDGNNIITLEMKHYWTEFEKFLLKSPAEVNQMFAANLKARLVVTGTGTSGRFKSDPKDKFAITCIVVSGRGTAYFWDWSPVNRDPSNASHLEEAKLIIEVNANNPCVVAYTPAMFPMGMEIVATKASTDPYIGVFVYAD